MRNSFLFILLLSLPFGAMAAPFDEIEHTVLATVNGKAITSFEVMKKMEEIFQAEFPEYADMDAMRAEFYRYNWKHILKELVEKELVLADAKEKKLPVSDGDIRQELEMAFGPNIYEQLDSKGLSFEEAWDYLRNEIMVRRMLQYRVNSKAVQKVTPKGMIALYQEYVEKNPPKDKLTYQVFSIRCKSKEDVKALEKIAKKVKWKDIKSMRDLYDTFLLETAALEEVNLNLSDPMETEASKLSKDYKEELDKITPGQIGNYVFQKSRTSNVDVFRVFALQKRETQTPPPFHELQKKLEDFLIQKEVTAENKVYIEKLRQQFPIKQVAESESPFSNLKFEMME